MYALTLVNGTCYGSTQEALDIELEDSNILTIEYNDLSTADKKIYNDFCNLASNNIAFEIREVSKAYNIDRFTNKEFSDVFDYIDYSKATTSVKSKVDKFYTLIEDCKKEL